MKVIFLDRDGVINKYPGDKNYVTSWKDFHFLPGAKQAITKLSQQGFRLFVASNQAGVGKGLFSQKTLDFITKKMLQEIEKNGGKIEGVYYCTHRREENCPCRKPRAGLISKIKKNHSINSTGALFIGDTIPDVQTAKAAGCKSILVLSGKEELNGRSAWASVPDFIFENLSQAADFILKKN